MPIDNESFTTICVNGATNLILTNVMVCCMRRKKLLNQKKLDKVGSGRAAKASKRIKYMEKSKDDINCNEPKVLARDVSRFRTLFPNGEAKLREKPSNSFEFLNSAELVASNNSSE